MAALSELQIKILEILQTFGEPIDKFKFLKNKSIKHLAGDSPKKVKIELQYLCLKEYVQCTQKEGSERYFYQITCAGAHQITLHAADSQSAPGPEEINRNYGPAKPQGVARSDGATRSQHVDSAQMSGGGADTRRAQGTISSQVIVDLCHRVAVPNLDQEAIVKQFRLIANDDALMTAFAETIGQNQLPIKTMAAEDLLRLIFPRAVRVWGSKVELTLHGSRAKNTFIDDSDFDYHIENTIHPIKLDEMYKFRNLCREIPNVSAFPEIKMALSLQYTVPHLEDRTLHVEFVPERADYIDESSTNEHVIEKANTYFTENHCACLVVRLLKHLFQRTQPRLKACVLEQIVQQMHTEVPIDPARWRDDPKCTRHLFLLCLKQIEMQPECQAMAKMSSRVYPNGLPKIEPHSQIALMKVRRNPELDFREVSPLRCSPERALRELTPERRMSRVTISHE